MIKLAKILSIDSEIVTLKLEEKAKCTDCKNSCSDGFLSFLFKKDSDGILKVGKNSEKNLPFSHLYDYEQFFSENSFKNNDIIGVELQEFQLLKYALILYGMPILAIVFFLISGYTVFSISGLNGDIGGVIGFVLGLFLTRVLIQSAKFRATPRVKFFK